MNIEAGGLIVSRSENLLVLFATEIAPTIIKYNSKIFSRVNEVIPAVVLLVVVRSYKQEIVAYQYYLLMALEAKE
jgi:hypothetical protein